MRYSIRTLLLATSCVAVAVGMLFTYGIYGAIFAAINCGIGILCLTLFQKLRIVTLAFASLYVLLWIATIASAPVIRNDAISNLHDSISASPASGRTVSQFNIDPVKQNSLEQLQWPWYYVGNTSVPCPLVVAYDHAWMIETSGCGGRSHTIGLFGYIWATAESGRWVHCS